MVLGTATWTDADRLLRAAPDPAAVFGALTGNHDDDLARGRRRYRELAAVVHPDRNPDRPAAAAETFGHLTALWDSFTRTLGTVGAGTAAAASDAVVLTTRRRTLTLGDRIARGDLSNLYAATSRPTGTAAGAHPAASGAATGGPGEQQVIVKMTRDPVNNDLLAHEARVLAEVNRTVAAGDDARHAAYLPTLLHAFRHRDTGTGRERQVNALTPLDGFWPLTAAHAAYPAGCDPRDVAWMWRRLLVAVGLVHRAGVVHGAVLPEHVLIHPAQHGLVLVDFAYASLGDPISALVPARRDFYPAEVTLKEKPTAATDIAMAATTMTWLMGDRAPAALRAFAAGCTRGPQRGRPQDAWALLAELDDILERLYGPRRFRPFHLPART